jgi:radical SAM superfamily enzyme YgiQ (UPF0313 family)
MSNVLTENQTSKTNTDSKQAAWARPADRKTADLIFFQQFPVPYFGVLALATFLENLGYKSDVIIASLEEDPMARLKELNPAIVGISVLSTEHRWLMKFSAQIRAALPETLILVGGIHAQLYAQEILTDVPDVDIVCNSEGEGVMPFIFDEMAKKPSERDWARVVGISYRLPDGTIQHNERANLTEFDDNIVEDRKMYFDRYPQLTKDEVYQFFSARGCAYNCSFCYVPNLKKAFKNKGKFMRSKPVDTFIAEIVRQKEQHNIKSIFFYDDFFTYNMKWMQEFLPKYKEKVGIPFMCTTIADLMPDKMAQMLAEAGCQTVSFGIESGSYRIRRDILEKDITDEDIIRCGKTIRKYGIQVQTSNMFCLPGETLEDAFKTIEINIKAQVNFCFSALFLPFPHQGVTDHAIQIGALKKDYSLQDMPSTFLATSLIDIPDKETIKNVHRLAYFFVRWPWLFYTFKNCVRWTFLNPLFYALSILGNLLRHKEERGISFVPAIKFAWRAKKSFSSSLFLPSKKEAF